MKPFFSRPQTPTDPGLILSAGVFNGAARIESVMPGCRDPRPHQMLNVTLPQESRDALAEIIKGDAE